MYIYHNSNLASVEIIVDGKWYIIFPDGETIGGHEVYIYWHKTNFHPMLHDKWVVAWRDEDDAYDTLYKAAKYNNFHFNKEYGDEE